MNSTFGREHRAMRVIHGAVAIVLVTLAGCSKKPETAQVLTEAHFELWRQQASK